MPNAARSSPLTLSRLSLGMGDRFAHQAAAQLRACQLALDHGVEISPVWNKSNREHNIVGSAPGSVRAAADNAVRQAGWKLPHHVDADHIGLKTVDRFIEASDFFTIDVADCIGKPASASDVKAFADRHPELTGSIQIPGIEKILSSTRDEVERIAAKYLCAVQEAGRVQRHIESAKGRGNFITEVSMDETDSPQTPPELLIILTAIADERIPIQTIAPKFTGRFNKGVDYKGDVAVFDREFNEDLCVIAYAVKHHNLPANLKLSVHSGSDKFSIYPAIRRALARHEAGVHVKTAGTTWLEECIGMAEAGGEGLAMAREIYVEALEHLDELCAPYATVIEIDRSQLPPATAVRRWTSEQFVAALRHDPANPDFNLHLRQLLHVGFKVAAKMGQRYLDQLQACQQAVSRNVTLNLFERHIRPLFLEPIL